MSLWYKVYVRCVELSGSLILILDVCYNRMQFVCSMEFVLSGLVNCTFCPSTAIRDGVRSRFSYNVSKKEVRLSINATERIDTGSWICRAQVLHQMVKVGNAVEYSVQLVVVGEDMCVLEYLFYYIL